MMARSCRCAIFGQHPICFKWGFDEEDGDCRKMKLELLQQIMSLRQYGVTQFFTACDFGVGLYAAEQINVLRETDSNLMLFCVTPYEEQATKWAPYLRERYFDMLAKCSRIECIDLHAQSRTQLLAYALLCKHYDYVLENICGVELNSGVGYFLRAMRIHDTTTDYYRCLTDETGNHFLQVIMRRDGYAEILIDGAVAKISSLLSADKSTQTVTVQPENARELTGVLTKQKIFLPAGSDLVVSAENGVRGSARFSSAKELAPAEYIKLY